MKRPSFRLLASIACSIALSGVVVADEGTDTTSRMGEISQGERVSVDGKGFTIIAPSGWTVQKNLPRSSLFLQAQVSEGEYPRNIAVVRFNDPVLISDSTANDFAQRLVKLYPAVSSTIENYALRNHESIQMTDGREGILFYTDFIGSGRKMMQAHILLSSQTSHYLITYTDVAEHFENQGNEASFLTEAWASMVSTELDSPNPLPDGGVTTAIVSFIGLALIAGTATILHRARAARQYREYGDQSLRDGGDVTTTSFTSEVDLATSVYPSSAKTMNASKLRDDEDEFRSLEDGISSAITAKILTLKSKKLANAADERDTQDSLEFTKEPEPKQEFKRGA